ncbi:MAG: saccharopine dehydrogenase NADP-binding domain-containing protein [Candidatus Latescibacterota bacterium]|nr:MAG: saccharopine dehydrogenase NADP-binding domain-containing protein [Candidatus Latescibacterota bacterium]
MKILVLGAGKQGGAAAFDLLRNPEVEQVGVADADSESLEATQARLSDRRILLHHVDVIDTESAVELLGPYDACLNAVSYWYNLDVTRAAIEAKTHVCDLGGSSEVVSQQLKLDTSAFEAGVTIVPDCGLAPGLATILAAHGIRRLDEANSVHIRVGDLPQTPSPPFSYQLGSPVQGLIDKYSERAVLIRDGVRLAVEPLTEVEELEFPEPFGKLEAFNTAGGLSTLASTFAGKVRNLDYKTIRYPGHCAMMRPLRELGFFAREPIQVGDQEVRPRELAARILGDALRGDDPDIVLVRVTVAGTKFGGRRRLEYELVDRADETTGMSALMRCTSFTASAIAQMLARGRIDRHGVVPQERCVPAEELIGELRERGLKIVQRQS